MPIRVKPSRGRKILLKPSKTRRIDPESVRIALGAEPGGPPVDLNQVKFTEARVRDTVVSLGQMRDGILKRGSMYGSPDAQEGMFLLSISITVQLLTGLETSNILCMGWNNTEWQDFCRHHKLLSNLSIYYQVKDDAARRTALLKEWGDIVLNHHGINPTTLLTMPSGSTSARSDDR